MTQYLVAIHHHDDYDPSLAEDEAMHRDIDALNEEMVAAGVRVFVGGLQPVRRAKSLRRHLMAACWLPMARTLKPRSISAASGCWKRRIWTKR